MPVQGPRKSYQPMHIGGHDRVDLAGSHSDGSLDNVSPSCSVDPFKGTPERSSDQIVFLPRLENVQLVGAQTQNRPLSRQHFVYSPHDPTVPNRIAPLALFED